MRSSRAPCRACRRGRPSATMRDPQTAGVARAARPRPRPARGQSPRRLRACARAQSMGRFKGGCNGCLRPWFARQPKVAAPPAVASALQRLPVVWARRDWQHLQRLPVVWASSAGGPFCGRPGLDFWQRTTSRWGMIDFGRPTWSRGWLIDCGIWLISCEPKLVIDCEQRLGGSVARNCRSNRAAATHARTPHALGMHRRG
eukprot:363731-Chlamydomonas_euryale.AAC.4